MKNGEPFEVPLPRELTAPLERYLQHWRPVLLDGHPQTSRMWVSAFGRPLRGDEIHYIVTRRTEKLFGAGMNDPEHVGMASTLLSHRAPTDSSKPYNLARQLEATHQWQQHVRKLRRTARRRSRA